MLQSLLYHVNRNNIWKQEADALSRSFRRHLIHTGFLRGLKRSHTIKMHFTIRTRVSNYTCGTKKNYTDEGLIIMKLLNNYVNWSNKTFSEPKVLHQCNGANYLNL